MVDNLLKKYVNRMHKAEFDKADYLRVICVGLPRTGTASLKIALDKLGFGPCHHVTELFDKPQQSILLTRALDGNKIDWHQFMKGYGSAVDAPAALFYKEILQAYPKAKIIISVRENGEQWYESFRNTIEPVCNNIFYLIAVYPIRSFRLECIFARKMFNKWINDYGQVGPRVHNLHNARLMKEFGDQLLVFNVKEGWEPLCKFLNVPIPKDTLFPHVNDTKHLRRIVIVIQAVGCTIWALIIVVIAILIKLVCNWMDY